MSSNKKGILARIKDFFVDSKTELKKIVWPTQRTVWKNTGIVMVMIFIMGVFVAALDAGFLKLLSMVMTVSSGK